MSSKYGCPIDKFYSWWNYLPFNKWFSGILLFGLGVYFSVFGLKHFGYTSVVIIAGTTGIIVHGVFQPLIPKISFTCKLLRSIIYYL